MRKEVVKIGEKGQITIPTSIRKQEQLKKGEFLEVIDMDGVMVLSTLEKRGNILLAMKMLGEALESEGYKTNEDIIKLCREVRKEVS